MSNELPRIFCLINDPNRIKSTCSNDQDNEVNGNNVEDDNKEEELNCSSEFELWQIMEFEKRRSEELEDEDELDGVEKELLDFRFEGIEWLANLYRAI